MSGNSSLMILKNLFNLLSTVFTGEKIPSYTDFNADFTLSQGFFITTLIIPVAEELFFREHIQRLLSKHWNYVITILVTALLFSSIHFPVYNLFYFGIGPQDFYQPYMTFFGGLIAGYLYYKSDSIGPPIIMHVVWNFTVDLKYVYQIFG